MQEENSTTMDIVWTKNILRAYVNAITGRHTRSNTTAKVEEETMTYPPPPYSLVAGGSASAPSGVVSAASSFASFASLSVGGSSATLVSSPDAGVVSSGLVAFAVGCGADSVTTSPASGAGWAAGA